MKSLNVIIKGQKKIQSTHQSFIISPSFTHNFATFIRRDTVLKCTFLNKCLNTRMSFSNELYGAHYICILFYLHVTAGDNMGYPACPVAYFRLERYRFPGWLNTNI